MFVLGPRWHRFPRFDDSPGREIQRRASAHGEPVRVVGGCPSPAFGGLQVLAPGPYLPQKDRGDGPRPFSAVLMTKWRVSVRAVRVPDAPPCAVRLNPVALSAKPRALPTPALRSSFTASGAVVQSDEPASI